MDSLGDYSGEENACDLELGQELSWLDCFIRWTGTAIGSRVIILDSLKTILQSKCFGLLVESSLQSIVFHRPSCSSSLLSLSLVSSADHIMNNGELSDGSGTLILIWIESGYDHVTSTFFFCTIMSTYHKITG